MRRHGFGKARCRNHAHSHGRVPGGAHHLPRHRTLGRVDEPGWAPAPVGSGGTARQDERARQRRDRRAGREGVVVCPAGPVGERRARRHDGVVSVDE
ncbi:hypothetical protein RHA1_ro03273 [Rhodococcus jostii RHA1]|uniref:Uncharacterized protein n=1 Tax=Rhodococcus jostii (strain RHA1) TaxID=101510 RepID=Q0SBL0_RHOJR|nr:hypothetical protein RHA1_ro03273 [Rhodococcus jostii RHA1]